MIADALARRRGPSTSCDAYGYSNSGTWVYYHCYVFGETINGDPKWLWGRVAGTEQEGWFSHAYLLDWAQSSTPC
ncbi:hypothetical protein ACWD25_49315 [Streptomyces sp. NPDC002920]